MLWHKYVKGKKEDLCFLHGMGGSSSNFRHAIKYFESRGYGVLAIDLIGQGLSEKSGNPDDYSFKSQCRQIKEVLDHEDIDKAVLVGYSCGSLIAQEFYNCYPDRVSRLVLMGTHFSPSRMVMRMNALDMVLSIIWRLGLYRQEEFRHVDPDVFFRTPDIDLRRFFSDLRYTGVMPYKSIYRHVRGFENRNYPGIKVPVLLIHGRRDVFFDFRDIRESAARIKGASFRLIDANHMIPFNNYREMNKLIHHFLAGKKD